MRAIYQRASRREAGQASGERTTSANPLAPGRDVQARPLRGRKHACVHAAETRGHERSRPRRKGDARRLGDFRIISGNSVIAIRAIARATARLHPETREKRRKIDAGRERTERGEEPVRPAPESR